MAETTPKKTAIKKAPATKAAAKPAPAREVLAKTAAEPKAAARKPSVKKPAAAPATNLLMMPSHEDISRRAYELWAERGYTHGDHNHDWARAEHELRRA